ncbi:MAG: hypothetical protein WKF81_08105 [Thermomicrobiales bacterium]
MSRKDASKDVLNGVVQTIANGLSLVLARPLLMIVPLIMDLVLWLAWQISPKPFTNWLSREMESNGGSDGPAVAEEVLAFGERARVNDLAAAMVPSVFSGLPKDSIISLLLTIFTPGLARGVDRGNVFDDWENGLLSTLTPQNGFGVFFLSIVLLAVSTFFAVLFKVPQARIIREEPMTPSALTRDIFATWWRLALLLALIVSIFLVVIFPILLILGVLYLLGINLVAILVLGLFVFGGMAAMYTFFAMDAIVLNRFGPVQSLSVSFAVVRGNFGPTFRFAVVSLLIATGVIRVWDVLIENPPGIAIALVANAFLGTGLSIASLMFFQDRFRRLDPVVAGKAASFGPRWFR